MRRALLSWIPLVVIVALLSGCVGCAPAGPPVTARGLDDADAAGGRGDHTIRMLVTDAPGGPPLPGAGVVLYWDRDDPDEWRRETGGQIEVSGRGVVVVEAEAVLPTPRDRDVLRLTTDAAGRIEARVPDGRVLGVVVAKDGWTEEWLPAIASGAGGATSTLTIPLYRSQVNVTIEDTWAPGGASTGFVTANNFLWKPELLPFGDSDEARRGYGERLVELRARLVWDNGAQGAGDLAIGVGATGDQPTYVADGSSNTGLGEQREELFLTVGELGAEGLLGSRDLHVGPASRTGYVSPFGLPYTMVVEARFDPAIAALGGCYVGSTDDSGDAPGASVPGLGALGVFALMGAAALALRLRRRA